MATKSRGYSAEDIEILEDLSPILLRPGMYTDPATPNHALVEVIDNASDEGLAGFAKHVSVTLYEDGSAAVEDDDPTGWTAIDALRGIVKGAPADMAENHDRYIYGGQGE